MKALHLNLAARPYRDYRPVYAAVVVMSLAIAYLMLNNIDTYYRYVNETQHTRTQIEQIDRQAASERERTAAVEAQLRGVDVRGLEQQTRFINVHLAQRAFSWSELLDALEDVMPADVRIRSITPRFDKTGRVHLELSCEAKTSEGMLETITGLTNDPRFSDPFPHAESATDRGDFQFSIGLDYRPRAARLVLR